MSTRRVGHGCREPTKEQGQRHLAPALRGPLAWRLQAPIGTLVSAPRGRRPPNGRNPAEWASQAERAARTRSGWRAHPAEFTVEVGEFIVRVRSLGAGVRGARRARVPRRGRGTLGASLRQDIER